MPRFVGWVEARNPTNTLGFASLKRQVLQRREPPQRTGSPTYKKMAKVLAIVDLFPNSLNLLQGNFCFIAQDCYLLADIFSFA